MKSWLTLIHYGSTLSRFSVLPMLLSALSLIFQPSEWNIVLTMFFIAVIIWGINSFIAYITKSYKNSKLLRGDDAIIVTLTWVLTIVFSAIPFVVIMDFNWVQSIFEATSGWTTTGLSVVNVEQSNYTILLYRSLMQFFGGVGIVLIVFTLLSDSYGLKLYSQEGHNDRLLPNILKSARLIFLIYFGYVVAGILGYVVLGMSWFDAINISMAALSTGGFATRANSMAYYQSGSIEWFTMLLMILGSTNFAAHLLLIRRQFRQFIKTSEFKLLCGALLLSTLFILLTQTTIDHVSLRTALFEAVSAITTTGFQTTSYSIWRPLWVLVLILLMIIGGGSGSTAGGIKQSRLVVVLKSMQMHFQRYNLPRQVMKESSMHDSSGQSFIIQKTLAYDSVLYVMIYLLILTIGTIIISTQGYTLLDSFFEFASSLGTVGTSVGVIAFNASNVVLVTSTLGMLLGRLEILVVISALMTLKQRLFHSFK